MDSKPQPLALPEALSQAADRCVLCGACSEVCPTYHVWQQEAESPRGRIALLRGLAQEQLEPTPAFTSHLDHCLGCRACERRCPSEVHYHDLLTDGRALLESRGKRSWRQRRLRSLLLNGLIANLKQLRRVVNLLRIYQISGVQRLVRASRLLHLLGLARLESLLPIISAPKIFHGYYPPLRPKQGEVALFTGCLTSTLDNETIAAAIALLTRLGVGVHVPPDQGCCGALHQQHGADPAPLITTNSQAFADLEVDAVLFLATGCGLQLREYRHHHTSAKATSLGSKAMEICQYLTQIAWPLAKLAAPQAMRVFVHEPCTQTYLLGQDRAVFRLLARIGNLRPEPLPMGHSCCGAGSGSLIAEPGLAAKLRKPMIDKIAALKAETVVTANIGCQVNLQAGLAQQRIAAEVIHPVILIERLTRPTV